MKKKVFFISFLCISLAHSKTSVLSVETSINLADLYEKSITDVKFIPESIVLEANKDKTAFESVKSKLIITTSVPKTLSEELPYNINVTGFSGYCTGYSGEKETITNMLNLYIDSTELVVDSRKDIPDFTSDNGEFLVSEHNVLIKFDEFKVMFPALGYYPKECLGSVTVEIGIHL